jgi:VCBS repeat protein
MTVNGLRWSIIAGVCALTLSGWAQMRAAQSSSFPSYRRTLQLEATADKSANVSIGDIDGDGRLDLLLVKGRHWPGVSRVLLGDGHGHFPTAYDLTDIRYRSYSGNLVDIDGDGALDVVLSNDAPDPKVILLNDGKGHFRLASTFGQAAWPTRNVAIADFNGDGRPDIVVANRSDRAVQYVCLNRRSGLFDAPCVALADYSATTITPADIDGDGRIDLVVPHRDGGQSYVYLNGGNASFSPARRVPFGPPKATVRMAAVGDLNGDRILDIVTIDEDRRAVEIFYGEKAGGFAPAASLEVGKAVPYALAVVDLNRDSHLDILVGYVDASSAAFFGNGKRQFTRVAFGDDRGAVYGFAVADLDGDGYLDIAVARSDAPNMVYFGDQ